MPGRIHLYNLNKPSYLSPNRFWTKSGL